MSPSPPPPPPVSSAPSNLPQNDKNGRIRAPPLPPPTPPKPTSISTATAPAANTAAASITAAAPDPSVGLPQSPTQIAGIHLPQGTTATAATCGYEAASGVVVSAAKAGSAVATAAATTTAEELFCGMVLEAEYELEKVSCNTIALLPRNAFVVRSTVCILCTKTCDGTQRQFAGRT